MKKYCIIIIEKIDLKNLVRRITLSISIISDKCIKLSLQNFSLVHVITIKIIINIEYRPSYLFRCLQNLIILNIQLNIIEIHSTR